MYSRKNYTNAVDKGTIPPSWTIINSRCTFRSQLQDSRSLLIMLFLNQNVITPYGKGVYLGPSENPLIIKVQPTNWVMARETKPTFFMNPKDVKPLYVIGSLVSLTYGDGVITGFRESDCMYIVELSNWRLAQGQSPSLYLQESALSLTLNTDDGEKTKAEELVPEPPRTSYAETCIANAISIKEEAGIFYKKMDYNSAKDKYLKALEAIQVKLMTYEHCRYLIVPRFISQICRR